NQCGKRRLNKLLKMSRVVHEICYCFKLHYTSRSASTARYCSFLLITRPLPPLVQANDCASGITM
ncbi:hypothetical protein L9F63_006823, partial [Diploptera punctata]